MNLTTLRGDIRFWDRFAPWYEKWLTRGLYHQAIIREVTQAVEQGARVLDIGAGTGVLSLPLAALGCTVEAVEPSEGMRSIFSGKIHSLGVRTVEIVPERWETYEQTTTEPHDFIVACNCLHLTQGGLMEGMQKVFAHEAGAVCLITEINQDLFIDFKEIHALQKDYEFLFIRKLTVDSSFVFEDMDEAMVLSDLLGKGGRVGRIESAPEGIVQRDRTDVAVVMWEKK
jgi:2-polyprenyl-3-methyl-5-hydroxy-6-metoxy-1,4-benzoquinol methylase